MLTGTNISFLKKRREYFGQEIENEHIYPDEAKVKVIKKFQRPNDKRGIHYFLKLTGLTGYFHKFVRNYFEIARSLSNMLNKNESFSSSQQEVFTTLPIHIQKQY